MTPSDRERINLESMVAPSPPVIAGRQLAPFSAGRLQLCRLVGLQIIGGGAQSLAQSDLEKELVAFWFIHAFDRDTVCAACALPREEFFARHVEPLLFDFPARCLGEVVAFLEREFRGVEAAQVEAVPKPSTGGSGPVPPPNS